jgi:polar amino acid transport system substrate-binding protein
MKIIFLRNILMRILCILLPLLSFQAHSAHAQSALAQSISPVPSFFDPKLRLEKPDMAGLTTIRFLTDDDYPPFHFIGKDGQLTGFNIDMARAICDELKLNCTIQARRWDTLQDALEQKQGDAIIASIAATPVLRQRFDFSASYYRTPGRFMARKDAIMEEVSPKTLSGRIVGVIGGSAHEAFLKQFFNSVVLKKFNDPDAMRLSLKRKEIDIIFGDAIGFAFWLNGSEADNCCAFLGGPYTEAKFFGDGVGIVLRKNNPQMRHALDYALARLSQNGVFTTLYLKYFPIGFY